MTDLLSVAQTTDTSQPKIKMDVTHTRTHTARRQSNSLYLSSVIEVY